MHHHHTDMFNGIEAGVHFAEYALMGGIDRWIPSSGGNKSAGNGPASPDATERRATDERAKSSPGVSADGAERRAADAKRRATEAEKDASPATRQAREAIKDGKIQPNEKKVVEKAPVHDAIKGERTRLEESIKKAEGAAEHQRDDAGKLKLKDGKPIESNYAGAADTDHERLVRDLAKNKDSLSLDEIDGQIKELEDAGVTDVSGLQAQRDKRVGDENKVAGVIEEREKLMGTLEAEKVALEKQQPAGEATDYQEFRERARTHLQQFNENGGQTHEADLFSEDWDNEAGNVTFEQLAKDLENKDRRDKFAAVQGDDDGDGRRTHEQMIKHIDDVNAKNVKEGTRLRLRYEAARELQTIYTEYWDEKSKAGNAGGQIEQINAEVGILDAANKKDRESLSAETLETIDNDNAADTSIIAADTETDTDPDANTDAEQNDDGIGHADGGAAPGGAGGSGRTEPGYADGDAAPGAAERTEPGYADGDARPNGAGKVDIDYTKPEHRDRVLTQAQEKKLLPAENATFNDKGEAVYTVQPNDSYWRISDMSDGNPNQFDRQHFERTLQTNSERLGRDPQVGIIHPNEQLVIPGRSVQELVTLLQLPTTEPAPAEEQERQSGGSQE